MTKDEHLSKNTRQKIAEMMSLLPSNITEGKRSVMQRPSSLNVCMINTSSCRPPWDDYALVQTCTCLENSPIEFINVTAIYVVMQVM